MAHDHHALEPVAKGLDRRLWASMALNLGISLVEFTGGLWAGSLALLADSAHNLADVGSLGLAIFARSLGRRAPTRRHTYGFKRAEVIAALINAAVLIAISAVIGHEAIIRFFHPEPVRGSVMLVAGLSAVAANVASVLLLRTHRDHDINIRSAFLHLLQDALASLVVVVAALFAHTPAGRYLDPAAALLIGLVVLRSAISIVWESLHTLLEAAPSGLDIEELAESVSRTFRNVRLHHVHAWEVGPGQRALTAHMKVGDVSFAEAEAITASVRQVLTQDWGITHATLEAERDGCGWEKILGEWK